jgi:hypothetical protein
MDMLASATASASDRGGGVGVSTTTLVDPKPLHDQHTSKPRTPPWLIRPRPPQESHTIRTTTV